MPRVQRIAAWLVCVTVAIASVGVPLPARTATKSAEPFPCQHCPCGCTDAETCWRDCCCHTNREKLAWARKHGVTPPVFVIAAARRESCCHESASASCCSARSAQHKTHDSADESCCGDDKAASAVAHCASRSDGCSSCREKSAAAAHPEAEEASTVQVLLLAAKLRCGGVSLSVSLLPPSLVAPPTAFAIDMPAEFAPHFMAPLLYEPPFPSIAAPPPRRAAI